MDGTHTDQALPVLAIAGRRDALRSLSAAGMALLAAFGLGIGVAADQQNGGRGGKRANRRNHGDNRRRNRNNHDRTHDAGDPAAPGAGDAIQTERKQGKKNPVRTGPAGPTGPAAGPGGGQSETGPTGSAGPQGNPGDSGDTGDTGPMGPAGPIGPMGPAGQPGQQGPEGPTGPAGAVGPAFASVRVTGNVSPGLGPTKGSEVVSTASCSGPGKLLGGGYTIGDYADKSEHLVVLGAMPVSDQMFSAFLYRRADVDPAAAGEKVRAYALCRP